MNDLFLNSISAGNYNKSITIDTEYLLSKRPWSVGKYSANISMEQTVNANYDSSQKLLSVYVLVTIGGEPTYQLLNGEIELFKVSSTSRSSFGTKTLTNPTDGIFVFTYEHVTVASGDVFFVNFKAYDPFMDIYINQRSVVSGI